MPSRTCRARPRRRTAWGLRWRSEAAAAVAVGLGRKADADMCIGVSGKILALHDGLMPMADLDFSGTARECCLAYAVSYTHLTLPAIYSV